MRKVDPGLFSTAEVQLPLVVAVRSLGRGSAEAAQHLGGDFFQKASNAEMIMARPGDGRLSLTTAQKTAVPPNLDGVFSDPCWQNAKEVPLVSDPSHPLPGGSLALIAFDAQFLYVAASVARVADRHVPPIEMAGRSHDADMSASDHLVLLLDLDRDFATSYRFEIGERGETAESCWGDATWNPKWFASVTGDEHRWRIEAAIPLDALAARPPAAGEMWAVSFARVAPAVGIEGWPQPNDGTAGPGTFGLLRFE
jgi:hypothetical protein